MKTYVVSRRGLMADVKKDLQYDKIKIQEFLLVSLTMTYFDGE
jgi:hypothetical protein